MKRAVVRLGRIYAGERPGEIPKGLLRYSPGMKLVRQSVPLLIDHDEGKRVGTVDDLVIFDEIDGKWLAARAELYPDVGPWVKQGTPASFYTIPLHESSFVDGWILGGYIHEVSLLRRERPAEPGARITLLYEPEPKRTPAPVQTVPAAPVPAPTRWAMGRRPRNGREEIQELHARSDLAERAGLAASFEEVLDQLRIDLGYGSARPWWHDYAKAA